MIARFCDSANSGEDRQVCTNILAVLEKEDLCFIFHGTELPLVRHDGTNALNLVVDSFYPWIQFMGNHLFSGICS